MSNETTAAMRVILDKCAALLTEMGIPATAHGPTLFGFGFNVAPSDAQAAQYVLQDRLGQRLGLTFKIRPRGESTRVFAHYQGISL